MSENHQKCLPSKSLRFLRKNETFWSDFYTFKLRRLIGEPLNCMKNIQFVVMQTFCIMPFLQGLCRAAAYLPFAVPWETPKLVVKEPCSPNTLFQDL